MKLTKKGKICLNTYLSHLSELNKIVENTTPVNYFLLSQIDSLRTIISGLANAYDMTFEVSLLSNASDYLSCYNVVNGGDGSWAIALSDINSRKLVELTMALFDEFKNNLFKYVDGLPKNEKEINIFGIKAAYSNPQAIIDSAIFQMQGALQFYDYLNTEASLVMKRDMALKEIPNSFIQKPLVNNQIVTLIINACQIPSSYLRNTENRSDNNVAQIMQDSYTGALGYLCQLALTYYLETYAVSDKMEQPILFSEHIQSGSVMFDLVNKLNDFKLFAQRFFNEKHADYKIEIITTLNDIVTEQSQLLATKDRLECFYTSTYCDMYIAGKKLEHYDNTKQIDKFNQQKEITVAAIKKYLEELQITFPQENLEKIHAKLDGLSKKVTIYTSDICDQIVDIDRDIIAKLAITPTMVVHKLLKELSKLNMVHVEMVKKNSHTLGETGDRINDLYSFLLTLFTKLTMAEEPITMIKFKLIDSLVKSMEADLTPVKNICYSNDIIAIKISGGSPLHQNKSTNEAEKLEITSKNNTNRNGFANF